jgi:predicted Fe-Mo cluster-binding NifX family protein
MKLIITSQGPELSAVVDPRFGRALWFILFDTDTGNFAALDNKEQVEAPQGAGVQAAQSVVETGAQILLTGRCGPKAFQVLDAAGVQVYSGTTGTVAEALQNWETGKLSLLSEPDGVPRH